MSIGVPTRPATTWHGPRAENVKRLDCAIPALPTEVWVLDVNRSGVLLASDRPLRVGSSHRGRFTFEALTVDLSLRVAHVNSRFNADGGWRHRIGLSFRLDHASAWQSLDQLMSALGAATFQPSTPVVKASAEAWDDDSAWVVPVAPAA